MERERIVTLDFHAFARGLEDLAEPTADEVAHVARVRELLCAISCTGGPPIDARYLMGLPPGAFSDARRIVNGEATDAASQAARLDADPDGWPNLYRWFAELEPLPDPDVASRFI